MCVDTDQLLTLVSIRKFDIPCYVNMFMQHTRHMTAFREIFCVYWLSTGVLSVYLVLDEF